MTAEVERLQSRGDERVAEREGGLRQYQTVWLLDAASSERGDVLVDSRYCMQYYALVCVYE